MFAFDKHVHNDIDVEYVALNDELIHVIQTKFIFLSLLKTDFNLNEVCKKCKIDWKNQLNCVHSLIYFRNEPQKYIIESEKIAFTQ